MTKNSNNFLTFLITFILFLKTAKKAYQKPKPSHFPEKTFFFNKKKKQRELIKPKRLWINCLRDIKNFRKIQSAYKAKDFKKKIFFPFSSFTERALTKLNLKFLLSKRLHFFTAYNALNIFTWFYQCDKILPLLFKERLTCVSLSLLHIPQVEH